MIIELHDTPYMSLVVRKTGLWTNQAVQSHKMARGMRFRILEVKGLYYPCSENTGADQLRGCPEADLRLCFRICKFKAGVPTTRFIFACVSNLF